jgi:hypothetical protein
MLKQEDELSVPGGSTQTFLRQPPDRGDNELGAESLQFVGPVDVLFGRHKHVWNNPGNRHFRQVVQEALPLYMAAETRHDKSMVSNFILDQILSAGGRFYVYQESQWKEASEKEIYDKAMHALRDLVKKRASSAAKRRAWESSKSVNIMTRNFQSCEITRCD